MRFKLDPANFNSCPQFNQWIDDKYEDANGHPLDVLSFSPRPSEVLFQMSPATYMAAFADFQTAYDEDLKRAVVEDFPSPIAHYYYRFENGYENELQRLHLLRDTWEATVDILHALAVGEIRHKGIALGDPIKFPYLLSDSVAVRLQNIEDIVVAAATAGVNLSVGKVAPPPILKKMRELNQTRNAFSHSAAQSETQARKWISECYEDVLGILDDIRPLENYSLLRYMGQIDGSTLRCETFKGHSFTRTIQSIQLTAPQVVESQRYFLQGQMLVLHDGCLFSVMPLIFFHEDTAGHMTKPCVFRKTHGDAPNRRLEFAVVGDSVPIEENRATFKVELDEIRVLFGLGVD